MTSSKHKDTLQYKIGQKPKDCVTWKCAKNERDRKCDNRRGRLHLTLIGCFGKYILIVYLLYLFF